MCRYWFYSSFTTILRTFFFRNTCCQNGTRVFQYYSNKEKPICHYQKWLAQLASKGNRYGLLFNAASDLFRRNLSHKYRHIKVYSTANWLFPLHSHLIGWICFMNLQNGRASREKVLLTILYGSIPPCCKKFFCTMTSTTMSTGAPNTPPLNCVTKCIYICIRSSCGFYFIILLLPEEATKLESRIY